MEERKAVSPVGEITSTQVDGAPKTSAPGAELHHSSDNVSNLSSRTSSVNTTSSERLDGATTKSKVLASETLCAAASQSSSVQGGTSGARLVKNLDELHSSQTANVQRSVQPNASHLQSVQATNEQGSAGELQFCHGADHIPLMPESKSKTTRGGAISETHQVFQASVQTSQSEVAVPERDEGTPSDGLMEKLPEDYATMTAKAIAAVYAAQLYASRVKQEGCYQGDEGEEEVTGHSGGYSDHVYGRTAGNGQSSLQLTYSMYEQTLVKNEETPVSGTPSEYDSRFYYPSVSGSHASGEAVAMDHGVYDSYSQSSDRPTSVDMSTIVASSETSSKMGLSFDQTLSEIRAASFAYGQIARSLNRETSSAPPAQASQYDSPQVYSQLARRLSQEGFVSLAPTTSSQYPYSAMATESDSATNATKTSLSQNLPNNYDGSLQSSSNIDPKVTNAVHSQIEPGCYMYQSPASSASSGFTSTHSSHSGYNFSELTSGQSRLASEETVVQTSQALDYSQSGVAVSSNLVHQGTETHDVNASTSGSYSSSSMAPNYGYSLPSIATASSSTPNPSLITERDIGTTMEITADHSQYALVPNYSYPSTTITSSEQSTLSDALEGDPSQGIISAVQRHYRNNNADIEEHCSFAYENATANSSSTSLETSDSSYSYSHDSSSTNQDDSVLHESAEASELQSAYYPQTSTPVDLFHNYAMLAQSVTGAGLPNMAYEHVNAVDHSYYAALQTKATPLYIEGTSKSQVERYDDETLHLGMPNISQGSVHYQGATDYTDYTAGTYSGFSSDDKDRGQAYAYQEPSEHSQSDVGDAQYQLQYIALPTDPALDKENYAQLVQAGLATSTYIPEKHDEVNQSLHSEDKKTYSDSLNMVTPKTENVNLLENASCSQFSDTPPGGRRTSLPQIGTLVQLNNLKEDALYLRPDGIGGNILPRFSSFTQSSNAFSSMNSNDIKGPLKDYLLSSFTSQLPGVKKTEQSLPSSQASATYKSPDTTPVQFLKTERNKEKSMNQNRLKLDQKISTFADAPVSTVTDSLSPPVEVTKQLRRRASTRERNPRAPSAAAGSAAQLPKGGASSMRTSDLPRPSGSTGSHGHATAKQPRRRKSDTCTSKIIEKKKTEVVTCEPDSTQQGDPPEARLRSASVSQATREKHARGFYVHLPTRLQIFKPTPDDSNEISSTVEVCVSPVFGVTGSNEVEEVSSGSGVPITNHDAMTTACCSTTIAKKVAIAVEPTATTGTAVVVETTCGEDTSASPTVVIGHRSVAVETAVAKGCTTPSIEQKPGPSVAGTSRDYGGRVPVRAKEASKKTSDPTKDATKILKVLPEGEMDRKPGQEDSRLVQTAQPVHREQLITNEVTSKPLGEAISILKKNTAPEHAAPPKKRGRPRKATLSPSKDTQQEIEGSAQVAADVMVRSSSNVPKTKRKAGRPKKIERSLPTPHVNVEQDEHPMTHNLRKRVAGNRDTEELDGAQFAGSCGLVAASEKKGNLITLVSGLTEEKKNVDEGASKARKRKLPDGDDHEGACKMSKEELADGDNREGASKTREQSAVDLHGQEKVAKTSKKSAIGDSEDHESNAETSNVETLDSKLEIDLRELPQIRKKFPRKRIPERRVDTQSEADRVCGEGADKMVQSNAIGMTDNVESSEKSESDGSDGDTKERSLDKDVAREPSTETSDVIPGVITKPRGRPPKKKATIVDTAKSEVEPTGNEVRKKKRGRPKLPKDKIVNVDRGSAIPDSAIPDWVVQKSQRGGKYNSYNYQQKEDLLKLAEEFGGRAVASKLNIPVSTISCWKRTFKKDANRDPMSGRKIGSGRKLCYGNEVDELILQWILECRDLHCPTTVDDIGNYAGKIVRRVDGCETFKASHGWVAKFRNRHVAMLDGRTPMSQKLPPKLENLITQFQSQIHEIQQEYSIDPSLIINMDEVPIYFDLTGKKMKSSTKVKQEVVVRVTIGRKQHLTLLGAVTSEGKGLKPMLVMKGKSDDIEAPPHSILAVTEKGNVDQAIMVEWIQRVLLPYTHGRPSLLVIDSYEPHRVEFIMELFSKYNVIVAVIPEGCNSRLQPVSISVCKLFRSYLKESWFHSVKDAVSKLANMPSAHWTNEEMESIAKWVVKGWDKVWRDNLETIKKSFKVCGISNAVDGSEANLIRNDSYLDVTSFCQEQDHDKAHGFWY